MTTSWLKRINILTRCVIAAFLLSFYLVPNTFWSTISPQSHFLEFELGCSSLKGLLLMGTLAIAVWSSFLLGSVRRGMDDSLWTLVGLYVAVIVLTAIIWHRNLNDANNCILLASALAVGLFAARLCGTAERISQTVIILAAVEAVYALYYNHAGISVLISGNIHRAGGTFNQPNSLYTEMMLALPLAVTSLLGLKPGWSSLFYSFCTAVIFAALLSTWSRGGLIASAISVTWLMTRFVSKPRFFLPFAGLSMLIVVIAISLRIGGNVNAISATKSDSARITVWHRDLQIFDDHWLTGVGVGSLEIPIVIPDLLTVSGSPQQFANDPKSYYMLWLDEMGLPGGLLLLLLIVTTYSSINNRPSQIEFGLSAAWMSLLIAGLFDTPAGLVNRLSGNALVGALWGATLLLSPKSLKDTNYPTSRQNVATTSLDEATIV